MLSRNNATLQDVVQTLQPIVAPRVMASADLFVGEPNVQAFEDVVQGVAVAHQHYDHVVYEPVFVAPNEANSAVFIGLQWVLQHKASSKISRGVAIERVGMDDAGRVCSTSSMRTMIAEERTAVLAEPRAADAPRLDPALLALRVLGGPKARATASGSLEDGAATLAAGWFNSWALPGQHSLLPRVMADGAKAYDGMGLHTRPSIGCEGLLLCYSSRWEAEEAAQALHAGWHITQAQLTDVGATQDSQAIFCEWRARAQPRAASGGEAADVRGMALLLLDRAGLIHQVVQFVRMPKHMWHVPMKA